MGFWLPLSFISLSGATLVLLSTRKFGIGLSPDSVAYISAARSLAQGYGLHQYDGNPLIFWPPFYPMVLAVASVIVNTDPVVVARFLNTVTFSLLILGSGLYFKRILHKSTPLALIGATLVLFSIPLINIAVMAWTDLLFMLLCITHLMGLLAYQDRPTGKSLGVLTVSASLALLTRYMGIAVVFTGLIFLALRHRKAIEARLSSLFLYLAGTLVPFTVWVFRNYWRAGTFFGPRLTSRVPLVDVISRSLQTITNWWLPVLGTDALQTLTVLSCCLIVAAATLVLFLRTKDPARNQQLSPPVVFVSIYMSLFVFMAWRVDFDQINNRLLAPAYVPIVLLMLLLLQALLESILKRVPRLPIYALALSIGLIHSVQIIHNNTEIRMKLGAGGYSRESWHESETLHFLRNRNIEDEHPIFSNAPDVIYVLTGLKAKWLPSHPNEGGDAHSFQQELTGWNEEFSYLITFDRVKRDYLLSLDELKAYSDIVHLHAFKDGDLYRVGQERP